MFIGFCTDLFSIRAFLGSTQGVAFIIPGALALTRLRCMPRISDPLRLVSFSQDARGERLRVCCSAQFSLTFCYLCWIRVTPVPGAQISL